MRDLSQLRVSERRRSLNPPKKLVRVIILVLVVLGFAMFLKSHPGTIGTGGGAIALSDAPRGLKPVQLSGVPSFAGEGTNLTTQTATLKDVKFDGEASGVAKRSFGGGTYILSVEATLPDPKNTYYEVWLAGPGGILPIDFMKGNGTSWSLSLRDSDKYSGYGRIWVTLERTKDAKPEEHVLEGTF